MKRKFISMGLGIAFPIIATLPALADVQAGLALLEEGNAQDAATKFQEAYDAGDGDGAFYLGRMFELGAGADADPNRAANLYAAAVEKGSTLAMNRLGLMFLEGNVLLRDYSESTRLFCQAADAGDPTGELNCGVAYQLGRGVEQDVPKSIEYLEKASADRNSNEWIAAQNILGQIYLEGVGVPRDEEKAIGYFEVTADQGNALGLFQLAVYNYTQDEPNLPLAYSYANLAAVRGLEEALQLRDQLEEEMTTAQINEGQALSKAWTEERIDLVETDEAATSEETTVPKKEEGATESNQ